MDPNYVRTTTHLDGGNTVVATEYFDGLGRSYLSELDEGTGKYILSLTEYDELGRVRKNWKPYRALAPRQYDQAAAIAEYNNSRPFVETTYLADPLGHVDKIYPAGTVSVFLQHTYGVGDFGSGPRTYVETTDEDNKKTRVYTDAFGNQVQSEAGLGTPAEAITTMDYDILGNLVAVKPPNYNCNGLDPECKAPLNANWITSYQYDPRGLLTSKVTPDTEGSFAYTYDAKGNLRYVVDPRGQSEIGYGYLYTDYDSFDRVKETGRCTTGSPPSIPSGNTSCATKEEVVTYTYDSYDLVVPSIQPRVDTTNTLGRLTKVVFEGTSYYQYFYDNETRVVDFYVYLADLGEGKLFEYDYDLQGNITKVSYQAGDPEEQLFYWYEYDTVGRLKRVKTNTEDNEATAVQEAHYLAYTSTGQVKRLQLGNGAVIAPLDYEYHIRDWLTQINDPDILDDPNSTVKDKFAMRLGYDDNVENIPGATLNKNGNVSFVTWAGYDHQDNIRPKVGYTFSYDGLNRLTNANFQEVSTGWQDVSDYDVPTVGYDPNGNITALHRWDNINTLTQVSYDYQDLTTGFSNRLRSVTGVSCADPSCAFTYDANGNMKRSRVASDATYDRRNLPTAMSMPDGASLAFVYDADGQRIVKTLNPTEGAPVTTYYVRDAGGGTLAVYVDNGSGPQLQYWNILSGGAVIGRIVPPSAAPPGSIP